ncbi:hypothetical protein 000TH008_266 [Bacillus phage 000TH008]|nr:hypothetical protein 000TH008_8 [Bacillus phage 000TH008]QQO40694.1 hypothetical protein 000TH008_266 [Bacillus phage 000TH008]QQO40702.1 hypothetical protein 000TH009_8 [Bacillus phage 000TH009]QQO40959.1 hypothetical protein 000TH009_266 [Bacillus phage 000TH009]
MVMFNVFIEAAGHEDDYRDLYYRVESYIFSAEGNNPDEAKDKLRAILEFYYGKTDFKILAMGCDGDYNENE